MALSAISAFLAAMLLLGGPARHAHESGSPCPVCIFAPFGRRSPDMPGVGFQDVAAARPSDQRHAAIRIQVRRQVAVCRARPLSRPPSGVVPVDEGSERIHAPPQARTLGDLESGLNGRAPPCA